ncbi:MAG: tyrosine-type recombinase/integrase [Bacteroidota bacterium]
MNLYLLRFDRAHTRRAYRNDLVAFFGTESISIELARTVSFVDVNEHVRRSELSGLKPSTLRRRIAALRGFFSWLVALGALERNPADRHVVRKIRSGHYADNALSVLTRTQARALIECVDLTQPSGRRDRTLLLMLLHCVLRRSEAAAMQVEHLRQVGAYWVLNLPQAKGGSDQYVKVPDFIKEEMNAHLAEYQIPTGYIWKSFSNNSYGRPLSDRSIYTIVNKYAVKSGLTSTIGAHTLRHTGCTLAIENGASLQQVQAHARHMRIETTMVYIHQRDRLRDSAADRIRLDG